MVSQYLEVSSRIQAIDSGASHGASCNTFVVQDTVIGKGGIAEMLKWCAAIPSVQGAPTIILSNLRGRGELTSKGVTIQGACELVKVIDSIVTYMKRPGKKNSACVCFLDANHPDLDEWLSQEFTHQLQTVYLGVLLYPGKDYTRETLEKLVAAYEAKRIFICKVTQDQFGNLLYPNVCTEIRQQHKSSCTLAAIKLHEMAKLSTKEFADAFAECAENLISYLPWVKKNAEQYPDLYSYEAQVGLGFVGMSNFIGKLGTTYQEIVQAADSDEGYINASNGTKRFYELMNAGLRAGSTIQLQYGVSRLWTAQPTAHTSLRLKDGEYAVCPELAPVMGGTRASDGLIRVFRKNHIDEEKGGVLVYPEYCQTDSEVPYEVYLKFCEILHTLMALSFSEGEDGMTYTHTFSHSVYKEQFTLEDLIHFFDSPLASLYYRLEPTNVSRDKTTLGDDVDLSDVFEDDEPTDEFCPIDPVKRSECEACSM